MQLAYQPEYHLGWRDHDQIYMAWKLFGEMFLNDTVVRCVDLTAIHVLLTGLEQQQLQ